MCVSTQMSMSVWKRQHVVKVHVIMKKVDIHVAVMMAISCPEITALVKVTISLKQQVLRLLKNVSRS